MNAKTHSQQRPFTVAAIQFNPEIFEFDRNVDRACAVIEEAAVKGARLIVLPEAALSGYIYRDLDQFLPFMDTVPGVATTRIAEGEYDLDLSEVLKTRFPDEMAVLAESFTRMAEKVRIRERTLTQQVRQLRVEIDAAKREQAVAEITESDHFASIAAKADALRRRNDDEPADTGGDPPS